AEIAATARGVAAARATEPHVTGNSAGSKAAPSAAGAVRASCTAEAEGAAGTAEVVAAATAAVSRTDVVVVELTGAAPTGDDQACCGDPARTRPTLVPPIHPWSVSDLSMNDHQPAPFQGAAAKTHPRRRRRHLQL